MPGQFEGILDKLQTKLGKQTIKRASTINRPRPKFEVQQIDIFNKFNRRNPKADGGSVNGSEQAAFRAKVEELMDDGYDFGEAVREAMRQGYKKGGALGDYSLESGRYDTLFKRSANFAKPFFKEALKNKNFNKIKSKMRGTGGVFNDDQLRKLRRAFNNPYLMKLYTKEMGITPAQFKKVLNEGTEAAKKFRSAASSAARIGTPSVKTQGLIFDEILNNPSATVKSMAKKFKKTEKEITKMSSKLLKNVYTQNVAIGKTPQFDIDSRGNKTLKKWLPDDFKTTDKFLDNFSNIDGLKRVQTENIGILIKNAYRNNPKKYTAALKGLNEYNKFKNKLPKNLKLDLDHPLSKSFLKGSGVSADKLLYVTPISTSYNRGFKQDLSMAYDEALLSKNKPRVKVIEKFADQVGVNIGKGSGKIKFGTTPITKKTQSIIGQEILTNLEKQNLASENLEKLKKTKEGREKLKQIFPTGQKLTIPKVAKSVLKKVAKAVPIVGTAIGIADVANAYEQGVRNPIDLFAAYQISPEAALAGKQYREDPEYRQKSKQATFARPLDEGTYDAIDESFTSYFDGGIVSVLKGVK